MGTKAFLQKGRTKPGVVLPAAAVAKVNQASDRRALVRAARQAREEHDADPMPNIGTSIAAKELDAPTTEQIDFGSQARLTVQTTMASGSEPEVVTSDEPVKLGAGATLATMQAAPIEPDPAPLPPAAKPSLPLKVTADPDAPLTTVAGIGTALAERFATYGYRTLVELAQADPNTLNEIQGVRTRGRQWVDEARKRLGLP